MRIILHSVMQLLVFVPPVFSAFAYANNSIHPPNNERPAYRFLPGDPDWPTEAEWNKLNETVHGRLIKAVPLAQPCFDPVTTPFETDFFCTALQDEWDSVTPYLEDPVHVMSPYWLNNSCNPLSASTNSCSLGNMASYAIYVNDAATAIAGLFFAKEKNLRLTIKNTGHDYLGRSAGEGSLALWMHNLKDISVITNYTGASYTGPAIKVGAGVEVWEVYSAAQAKGLRIVGGGCPTVGVTGGWLTGGGHGPLSSAYGLGADEALEYEVVTANGHRLVASPTGPHADLYWALSGGGPGNFALVLSVTIKAHQDGPAGGLSLSFTNDNPDAYWSTIAAWIEYLLLIDRTLPTVHASTLFTNSVFSINFLTLPGATSEQEINDAIDTFLTELEQLNVSLASVETQLSSTFYDHYQYFTTASINTTNETLKITGMNPDATFVISSANVTHENVGNTPGSNSILPAWREALFEMNFGLPLSPEASWDTITDHQEQVNDWVDRFRAITPHSGCYMNEATWDNPHWKKDYFGVNYPRLAQIKAKYDPDYFFFAHAAVGSDVVWSTDTDGSGRLYRL
ncbi:FAD-binding domain-containing protein [Penicillium herquei]|nr:FAD-binding domain-containing protein [Penicillium herquei]